MVPKRRRGQARRAGAACIKSFAHQSGDNVSQEAEMLMSGAGHRSPAAPQWGYSLTPRKAASLGSLGVDLPRHAGRNVQEPVPGRLWSYIRPPAAKIKGRM